MSDPARLHLVGNDPPPVRMPQSTAVFTIHPERVQFFWPGRLASGKITVIDGDPGLGKSTLTLDIAAKFSTGEPLYGGDRMLPRGVLILSAEDGEADTIRPRLEAAGANLKKVFVFKMVDEDGNTSQAIIPDDLHALEQHVQSTNAGLVIIDPFMAFLSGEKNANRDQDVRGALAPLASMAERNGCAVIILRHLNKSLGSSPMYRGGGSIGIIGAARFGFIIAKDPEDPSGATRVMAPQKINIGPEPPALAYHLEGVPGTDVARINWLGEASVSTMNLLESAQTDSERSVRSEARSWLSEMLKEGSVAVKDLQAAARTDGIGWRTVERVKYDLGVVAQREGFGRGSNYVWRFPVVTNAHKTPTTYAGSRGDVTAKVTSMDDAEWPED